jgi:hypothetical protein
MAHAVFRREEELRAARSNNLTSCLTKIASLRNLQLFMKLSVVVGNNSGVGVGALSYLPSEDRAENFNIVSTWVEYNYRERTSLSPLVGCGHVFVHRRCIFACVALRVQESGRSKIISPPTFY